MIVKEKSEPLSAEASVSVIGRIGLGTAAFGHVFREVDENVALATVEAAWTAGIRLFDTAHLYGGGVAELRLGEALSAFPRNQYRLSTKVGCYRPFGEPPIPPGGTVRRANDEWDYGYDRTLAAIEKSLERLRVDRIDIVFIHGFDNHVEEALGDAHAALARLKDEGVIGAIGGGCDSVEPLIAGLERDKLDVVLCAGRYTLLDRAADERLLTIAADKKAEYIAAGLFNSGILATGVVAGASYDYSPAKPAVMARTRDLEALCRAHGVSLKAAALQFPLRNAQVAYALLGASSADEISDCLVSLSTPISDNFWDEVAGFGLTCGAPK